LNINFGVLLDPLSLLMLLIVTGVGLMIHIYSIGYMHGDPSFSRFFACLSFFTFSMLGIVLSDNFFQMFIFWELVGVSSYMLIGFWFQKPSAADAAKKAFLCNRIGDFGFLLGIVMVWAATGSLSFSAKPDMFGYFATAVGLLIFCGAVGKSAQFPLHVWLPDAMEGPTPVSALIHAATMVAAGVFMICRVFGVFDVSALTVIAWTGGITALMAALIAVQQNDIKRILAYSTLSQLGYMVMAVGFGGMGPVSGMFHLTTHAFFKALLFLGAGSVIHGLTNEQDIWKMGGLRKKMPATFWTFLIGTLALCGVPPLSGFYSKDSILAEAFKTGHYALFGIAVFVAILTTFYMFRLFFVVFLGKEKSHAAEHAHESPNVMVIPLVILAILSLIGGVIGIEPYIGKKFGMEHEGFAAMLLAPLHAPVALACGFAAVLIGFFVAKSIYSKAQTDPLPAALGGLSVLLRNKFYFDELYALIIRYSQDALACIADFMDRWFVGGAMVRGTQGATEIAGRALRFVQTGSLQTYTFFFATGVAVVFYLVFYR
jgi:NADH-quinone oxidoreductase subunit L